MPEGLEVLGQLTGLRRLHLVDPRKRERGLMSVAPLKQLTLLAYRYRRPAGYGNTQTFRQVNSHELE